MKRPDLNIRLKNVPELDPHFVPLGLYTDEFTKDAGVPVRLAFERENGNIAVFDTFIHENGPSYDAFAASEDAFCIERTVKFMLWSAGAFRIYVCGSENAAKYISGIYSENGARSFDRKTMERIYERPFETVYLPRCGDIEPSGGAPERVKSTCGVRIGMDIGCSNIKVCAVSDGKTVFMKTYPWNPSETACADMIIERIADSLNEAAGALKGSAHSTDHAVDKISVSTAGVFVNGRTRISSLFRSVPPHDLERRIYSIYPDICDAFNRKTGCRAVLSVINDGDAAALCAGLPDGLTDVLGISMGTSEAGGYVDGNGNVTGMLNEFAFMPLDVGIFRENGGLFEDKRDEWSKDLGCGVRYLSSEAVVRLAEKAGIAFESGFSLQDKVIEVQKLAGAGDRRAEAVFETVGCYLAHSVYTYYRFYGMKHIAVMGGVSAGPGGDILLRKCRNVLADEYADMYGDIDLIVPPEDMKTYGQCLAAALY